MNNQQLLLHIQHIRDELDQIVAQLTARLPDTVPGTLARVPDIRSSAFGPSVPVDPVPGTLARVPSVPVDPQTTMTLYFDGSAEVGRHRSGAGAVLYTMNPDEVYDVSQEYGDMTNNCAEYCGLIMGLEMIKQYCPRAQQLIIRGDSQLIIRQMTGKYKVKAAGLIPFHQRATELINELIGPDKIASIEFEWIERSLNERADILSRRGNVAAQRVR